MFDKNKEHIEGSISLDDLRKEIDLIDEKLIQLLDKRAGLVLDVGEWKKKNSYPIHDSKREDKIIEKITKIERSQLSDSEVQTLFKSIIEFYRNTESARNKIDKAITKNLFTDKSTFGFIGFGLMGASIALSLQEVLPNSKILIHDPHLEIADFELWNKQKARSQFQLVNIDQLIDLDFVFLAAPIDINHSLGKKINSLNHITLNLGSYQEEIPGVIGFHPLTGKESSGFKEAEANLFYNQTICITHQALFPKDDLEKVYSLANLLGAEYVFTTAEDHNYNLAYSSHLLQLLSLAYGMTLSHKVSIKNNSLIPGSAKNLLRLNGSNFKMWEPILKNNKNIILTSMNELEKNLKNIKLLLMNSTSEESTLKNSFRKVSCSVNSLKDLFIKGQDIYQKIYQQRKNS